MITSNFIKILNMKTTAAFLLLIIIGFSSCKSSNRKIEGPKGKFIVNTIGKDSVADKEISINFNPEKGQINGTGVCNSYSATYVVSAENIKFSPAMATKMMCPEGTSIEYNFFQALLKAENYRIKKGILNFYTAENKLILTAKDD